MDTIGHVFYRETTDPDLLSSAGKALDQLFSGFGNPIAMVVITYGSYVRFPPTLQLSWWTRVETYNAVAINIMQNHVLRYIAR